MGLFSSIAGPIAGSLVSGLIGRKGDEKAADRMRADAIAAANMIQPIQPSPFPVDTLLGSSTLGQFTPSSRFNNMRQFAQFGNERAYNDLQAFSRRDFADRFFQALDQAQAGQEQNQLRSLESRLFNRGGISSGTASQIAQFQNDINDARALRFIMAEDAANRQASNIFDVFNRSFNPTLALQNAQLGQQGLGLEGMRLQIPANVAAIQGKSQVLSAGLLGGADIRARSTQDFFGNLGRTVGGGVQAGIGALFGGRSSPASAYTPGGGFTAPVSSVFPNANDTTINPYFSSLGF